MMRAEIVHISQGNVSKYGGQVLDRVVAFATRTGSDAQPETLWANIAIAMVSPNPAYLVMAAVDDEDAVCGFMVSSLILFHGTYGVFIESAEIDNDARDGREEMMRAAFTILSDWGRSRGASFIRAWAMNEKLAKVFERFGLGTKPYILIQAGLGGA